MVLINMMGTESVQKELDSMIHKHAVWQDVATQLATVREREHNDILLLASVVHASKYGSLVMHTMHPCTRSTLMILTWVQFFGGGLDVGD